MEHIQIPIHANQDATPNLDLGYDIVAIDRTLKSAGFRRVHDSIHKQANLN